MKKIVLIMFAWIMFLQGNAVYAQVKIPKEFVPEETPFRTEILEPESGKELTTGESVVNRVLLQFANGLIFVAAPIAVILIVHAGFSYIMAFGNQEKLDMAKKEILWAVLGLFLVILSAFFIRWIVELVPVLQL